MSKHIIAYLILICSRDISKFVSTFRSIKLLNILEKSLKMKVFRKTHHPISLKQVEDKSPRVLISKNLPFIIDTGKGNFGFL